MLVYLHVALVAAGFVCADESPPGVLNIPDSVADTEAEMKPYTEVIRYSEAVFDMVPIPGGAFTMGSPAGEEDRDASEGPQHQVRVDPFWMARCEIAWNVYEVWMFDLDIQIRALNNVAPDVIEREALEYQLTQPTMPYTDMTFGMGKKGCPAISMTQFAARTFCQWLSAKTGRYYRLPTEAEWEYACRAGSTTAYCFGDDVDGLDEYGWYYDNSDERYQKVGQKKPNAWGLYDMHGNVAEWVLDQFDAQAYSARKDAVTGNPLAIPLTEYPRVVRGGSWDDDPEALRSAARSHSGPEWKQQDPQFPKSIWYHTDALHVGLRVVRPFEQPTAEERKDKWDKSLPAFDRKSGR